MKAKKSIIFFLILILSTVLFSQQISQKLKWEKIFDIAAYSKNIMNWKDMGLIASDSANVRLAENEAKIISLLSVTVDITAHGVVDTVIEYSPKVQVVVDYLKSISKDEVYLEKLDVQDLWWGRTPLQTSVVWRNATIRKWMDLNGVSYKLYWTKAKLLGAVAESLE